MEGRLRDVVSLLVGQVVALLIVVCCCCLGAAVMLVSGVAWESMAVWFDSPGLEGWDIVTGLGLMLVIPAVVFLSSTLGAGCSQSMLYPVEVLRVDVWPRWWGGVVSGMMTGFMLHLPSLFSSFFVVLVGFGLSFTHGMSLLMMCGAIVGCVMFFGGFVGGCGAALASAWRVHRAKRRAHPVRLRSSSVMSMA